MPYGSVLAEAHVASVLSRIGDEDALRELFARLPEEAIAEAINTPALADAMWATADRALAVWDTLMREGRESRSRIRDPRCTPCGRC